MGLHTAIEIADELMDAPGKAMDPEKKARLIVSIYRLNATTEEGLDRRAKIIELFPEEECNYKLSESPKFANTIFPNPARERKTMITDQKYERNSRLFAVRYIAGLRSQIYRTRNNCFQNMGESHAKVYVKL